MTEKEEKQEVVKKNEMPALLQMNVKDVDSAIAQAEKWIELKNRIRLASLKMTMACHWVDQNGKPYLEIGGSERIADGWGISIVNSETTDQKWLEDSKGHKYYEIRSKVKAKFREREYEQEGSATSKDKFFGRSQGKLKDESEINISDIRKKALTNAMNRVIKSIVGLSDVSWEELESAGIKRGTTTSVSYKTGNKATEGTKPKEPPKPKAELKGDNWWSSVFNGKTYIHTYNENSKLNHNQLLAYGFKWNEEKQIYSREYAEDIAKVMNDNFMPLEDDIPQ